MSFDDRDGVIWLDGKMVPWREAKVHVLTHTLHYGLGVFEGVRAYNTEQGTAIFRLHAHTDRLFRSAHILRMDALRQGDDQRGPARRGTRERPGRKAICARCASRIRGHGPARRQPEDARDGRRLVLASYMDPEARERGIKVRTSSYTRHHVNITMCKAKANGNYINSMLALREALDSGCEEALLLDNEGYVAEGSGENVFMVRNGNPAHARAHLCLEGITRDTIINACRRRSASIRGAAHHPRRSLRRRRGLLHRHRGRGAADPRSSMAARSAPARRGPITERLQARYFELVRGKLQQYPEWLTPVTD
jgi:branched-chain amino acid aminotransferase